MLTANFEAVAFISDGAIFIDMLTQDDATNGSDIAIPSNATNLNV